MRTTDVKERIGSVLNSQLWPALVYVLALAYLFAQWNVTLADVGDEGISLMGGWRVAMGQVPHTEFFSLSFPVSYLPTAAAFLLGGVGFPAARAVVILYAVLLLLLSDQLVTHFTRDPWIRAFVLAFSTVAGVMSWPIPSHHWLVDLCALGAGLCLLRALRSGLAKRWCTAAGLLTGLAVLSMQDQGGLFVLGLGIFFFPWIADRVRRREMLWSWLGGGSAVAIVFCLIMAAWGALGEALYQGITFPMTRYYGVEGQATAFWDSWLLVTNTSLPALLAAPVRTGGSVLVQLMLNILPYVALLGLLSAAVRPKFRNAQLGILVALVFAFLGTCLRRYSVTYLTWAAPALLLMTAHWLGAQLAATSPRARTAVRATCGGLTALLLLHGGGVVLDSRSSSPSTTVLHARAGTIRMEHNVKSAAIVAIVGAIEQHVPVDAPLFCNGYLASFNFLTLRPNPTQQDVFLYPGFHTDAHALEVRADLTAHPSAYVLTEDAFDQGAMGRYLKERFHPVWRGYTLTLYAPL